MSKGTDGLLSYIRAVAGAWRNDPRDDTELITRFVETRDETAFAALVDRHGALVWQTCRHLLGNTADAEDAFQTVFLALTRKAGLFPVKSLAGWLHRVARRTALRTRAGSQRRQKIEQDTRAIRQSKIEDTGRTELYSALDEELESLPERLRVPLLLRYLEGKTQVEVAKILGCGRSTLQERLEKGEAILRKRLERRGLTLGGISLAALFGKTSGTPAMPSGLITSTARAAVAFRAGTLTGVSADSAEKLLRALTVEGVVRTSWWMVLVSIFCLGVGGTVRVAWKMYGDGSNAVTPTVPATHEPVLHKTSAESRQERVDRFGDSLPEGALTRIGTRRFRLNCCNIDSGIAFFPDNKTLVTIDGNCTMHFWELATGKQLRQLDGVGGENDGASHKIAISSDGRMLACRGEYWDLTANPPRRLNREKLELQTKTRITNGDVAFSPDNKIVAWASESGNRTTIWSVHLVDTSTGKVIRTLNNVGGGRLAFSFDGKTLATGSGVGDVTDEGTSGETVLWDVSTGTKRLQIAGNGCAVTFLAFLPDGKTLLESRYNGKKIGQIMTARDGPERMRFLNAVTGEVLRSSNVVRTSHPFCCKLGAKCLSRDGKLLSLYYEGVISVWDMATGREVGPTGRIHTHPGTLVFSPDNKRLVSLSAQESPNLHITPELQVWETETGQLERELTLPRAYLLIPFIHYSDASHLEVLYRNAFDANWSHDNADLTQACVQEIWNLWRWDLTTGKLEDVIPNSLPGSTRKSSGCCAISSDGQWQALASTAGVTLVDRNTGKEAFCFPGTQDAKFVSFAADGQSVLAGIRDEKEKKTRLEVWSVATGKLRSSLSDVRDELSMDEQDLWSFALSLDGRWLAAATSSEKTQVRLFEVISGRKREEFDTSGKKILRLAWSPDGRLLAGGDDEGTVWLWDVVAGREVRCFREGHLGEVTALAFSPDGHRLASGSRDTTALIWDLRDLSLPKVRENNQTTAEMLWASLKEKDPAIACRSIHLLAQMPDAALPLLCERLRPTPLTNLKQVMSLLALLDNDNFQVRKQAEDQLEKMGEKIEPILQEALAKKSSPEIHYRIINVMNKMFGPPTANGLNSKQLQACRGVEVLERIGTPAARSVLEELSRLPKEQIQSEESKAALHRLERLASVSAP